MAVLTEAQRQQAWRAIIRYWNNADEVLVDMLKTDIRDAVDTTDTWIDTHEGNTGDTTGYNGSLPAIFKANATAGQKSDLFIIVAARRRSKEMLQLIISEVD